MLNEADELEMEDDKACLENGKSFNKASMYSQCCSKNAKIKGKVGNTIYFECYNGYSKCWDNGKRFTTVSYYTRCCTKMAKVFGTRSFECANV